MKTGNIKIKLPSGLNVDLSEKIYEKNYCNFNEFQYFSFNNIINSGQYFPQLIQFIMILVVICLGHFSFVEIILCNIIFGIVSTLFWYLLNLYKIPGINFISCFIGGNIFRFFLHFVVIAIISIFIIGEWKVIIFCALGGLITQIVKSLLIVNLGNARYNDKIAIYISNFKK